MRRVRLLSLFAAVVALALPPVLVLAQTPGKDYLLIRNPQPTANTAKVEVLEFFWYGCPHCNTLQEPLEAWLRKKPADVDFRRMPAAFDESWLQLARTYYTLDAMNLVDKLHRAVFAAIHEKRVLDSRALMRDPKPLFDWAASAGIERQKFIDTYNSFAVNGRTQRTREITRKYDISGTPAIVVDGRYLTAPSMILGPDNSIDYPRYFQVLDHVIALARKNRSGK